MEDINSSSMGTWLQSVTALGLALHHPVCHPIQTFAVPAIFQSESYDIIAKYVNASAIIQFQSYATHGYGIYTHCTESVGPRLQR